MIPLFFLYSSNALILIFSSQESPEAVNNPWAKAGSSQTVEETKCKRLRGHGCGARLTLAPSWPWARAISSAVPPPPQMMAFDFKQQAYTGLVQSSFVLCCVCCENDWWVLPLFCETLCHQSYSFACSSPLSCDMEQNSTDLCDVKWIDFIIACRQTKRLSRIRISSYSRPACHLCVAHANIFPSDQSSEFFWNVVLSNNNL